MKDKERHVMWIIGVEDEERIVYYVQLMTMWTSLMSDYSNIHLMPSGMYYGE